MLNKKGFTIAEVIVSFSLITVILASVISSTVYYRGKLKDEEVITQLLDFKETITKMIYDDILTRNDNKLIKVERCIGTQNCINFTDKLGNSHVLKVEEFTQTDTINNIKRGVYLDYDDTKYMLPDSDLGSGDTRICDFIGGFDIREYEEDDLYSYTVKLSYEHTGLDKQYDIMFNIIGKEGMWVSSNIRDESRLTLAEESMALGYGTSGTNEYTYTGDGTVRCESSDTDYVTCSVDEENHNIVVIPQALTTSPITITVSADPTMNYLSPLNATFSVEVGSSVTTIYFDGNGGTVSPSSKEIAIPGSETYGSLPTPTKAGYAFIGWYTEENGGTKVVSSTPYIYGESPTQLYAHYVESAATTISSATGIQQLGGAKRYVGANPANYVKFNCSNLNDSSTCEDWRIIGVYGNNLKIIRATPMTGLQYNASGVNTWAGSTLETYLNQTTTGGYYYSLNQSAKDMIVAGVWDVGPGASNATAASYYTNAQTVTVTGKVGIIAVYEYMYAGAVSSACQAMTSSFFSSCVANDWLYDILTYVGSSRYNCFTLNPTYNSTSTVSSINTSGAVANAAVTNSLGNYAVSPIVYLNSNVVISGGTGTSTSTAYTLSYNQ